ncbi:MAG: hypothetical protein M2R45_00771 [Verrucomicrobia subdivision 3 bacterium]|nr:hypothetical protein [Limisphaerales bacterium]MCS1413123.1 hypothetical protein [Limisphaerales bacterium]
MPVSGPRFDSRQLFGLFTADLACLAVAVGLSLNQSQRSQATLATALALA